MRKLKLKELIGDELIKIQDDEDSSDDSEAELFGSTYFKDISEFKRNFSHDKIQTELDVGKILRIEKDIYPKPKVFNYLRNKKESQIILSRNIIDHNQIKKKPEDANEKVKDKGQTKLFNFLTEESYSWKDTRNNEISISVSNLWKREKANSNSDTHPPFEVSQSETQQSLLKQEIEMKFIKETHDYNSKSTNLATTIEGGSGEKNATLEKDSKVFKTKKIKILKNQRRAKLKSKDFDLDSLKFTNSRNKKITDNKIDFANPKSINL